VEAGESNKTKDRENCKMRNIIMYTVYKVRFREYSTHGRNEISINIWADNSKVKENLRDLGVDGKILTGIRCKGVI
jgi:hypothetical protein